MTLIDYELSQTDTRPAKDLTSHVGNTPLLPLRRLSRNLSPRVGVFAKAEWFNPGGSVKDRPALNIVQTALARGDLGNDRRLLDSTSGNMGISYATFGAALGIPATLAIPESAGSERLSILRALGAEIVLTDPLEGSDGAILMARRMAEEKPDLYWYANQYNNPANWQAHYHSTGPEILAQTGGQATHFVAGLGTSGTLMGTGRYLREQLPGVKIIAMQPDAPFHGLEGLKHMPSAIKPGIFEADFADRTIEIKTEDARTMVLQLAREEGLFVGVSSGAAALAALQVASELDQGVVVTVFPDAGYKYLSDKTLWNFSLPPERARVRERMLSISSDILARIHRNGEEAYPEEGAGFLLGADGSERQVSEILVLPNAREDTARHNRYLIAPEDYLKAESTADRLGLTLIGVFHSHPDHLDRPSEYDREWAQPFFSYVITSVQSGKAVGSRSWRLVEDRSQFVEEEIQIL